MDTDVRTGDVFASATGRNIVRVEEIAFDFPGSNWREVHWRRLTKGRAPTNSIGKCGLHSFPRGRTLVERGGVRVGDVWRDREDDYRVATLSGDIAQGTSGAGTFTFAISDIAAMRLVERNGKAV